MAADREHPTTSADYVPLIDLRRGEPADPVRRRALVEAIAGACENSGFFALTGHGVPEETTAELHRVARAFFALSDAEKKSVASDPMDLVQHGFHDDVTVQTFTATRSGEPGAPGGATRSANKWPELAGFRAACVAYYEAVDALAAEVMGVLAEALGLRADWFEGKFDDHLTPLAVNYYPALRGTSQEGTLRHDAHADLGTVTLLHQDDAPGWLQVRHRDGRWSALTPRPGTFVVNLGRLMSRWTNGRWPSTVHRVVTPPDQTGRDRVSIAYFLQPNPDAVISCIASCADEGDPPRYADITAGEYLRTRIRRVYLERLGEERSASEGGR